MDRSFFLIAGEPSGDALGASLIKGLKQYGAENENFSGVGGPLMQEQGFSSLLPMDELCVMGLWEVAGQLPRLLRLINGVVEEIEKLQPHTVVTIDLPDFNFQVGKRLKKRGIFKGKIIHFGAPTVWAWRPERAKKVAEFLDGMMCLFPFEPPYFEKYNLRSAYVGHPLTEVDKNEIDVQAFADLRGFDLSGTNVGVFFGSREGELKSLSKPFLTTMEMLKEQCDDLHLIVPTLPQLEYDVSKALESIDIPFHLETHPSQKWNAFAACDYAIAASGTVGLELSYIGVPHIIGYKAHPITAIALKFLLKTKYAHLANILLDREAVPEFLQLRCSPPHLIRGLLRLMRDEKSRNDQLEAFKQVHEAMMLDGTMSPSERAARFVLT